MFHRGKRGALILAKRHLCGSSLQNPNVLPILARDLCAFRITGLQPNLDATGRKSESTGPAINGISRNGRGMVSRLGLRTPSARLGKRALIRVNRVRRPLQHISQLRDLFL